MARTSETETEAETFFGDLLAVAGEDAVKGLIETSGGTVVYIPRNGCRDESSALVVAWGGLEAANAIIEKLNRLNRYGLKIGIPLKFMSNCSTLGLKIRADILAGNFSISQIAIRFGVTERTIYNHKNRLLEAGLLVPPPKHLLRTQKSRDLRQKLRSALLASDTRNTAFIQRLAASYGCSVSLVASVRRELAIEGAIKLPVKGGYHG